MLYLRTLSKARHTYSLGVAEAEPTRVEPAAFFPPFAAMIYSYLCYMCTIYNRNSPRTERIEAIAVAKLSKSETHACRTKLLQRINGNKNESKSLCGVLFLLSFLIVAWAKQHTHQLILPFSTKQINCVAWMCNLMWQTQWETHRTALFCGSDGAWPSTRAFDLSFKKSTVGTRTKASGIPDLPKVVYYASRG